MATENYTPYPPAIPNLGEIRPPLEIEAVGPFDDLPRRGRHFAYHLGHELNEDEMVSIYIGVTSNLRARMRDHGRKWWWPMVNCVEFVEQPSRAEAERWEREMIAFYNPDLNVSLGVGRKRSSLEVQR